VDAREDRGGARRIEVTAEMDTHGVEAFYLEVRRLARRYGVDVQQFRSERMPGKERRTTRTR
jgi:hypothetical protein